MSYDLTFSQADGAPRLSHDAFVLTSRDVPITRSTARKRGTRMKTPGVYFSFDYDPRTDAPEDWDDIAAPGEVFRPRVASFNVNLIRPSFFGLEAAGELDAFSRRFGLIVHDDQIDGQVAGAFSSEQFIDSWSATNRWACSAVRESSDENVLTYPGDRLQKIWRWNFQRRATQEAIGDSVFVPKISFALTNDAVRTFVVWPDGIPALLPEVDVVVLVREALA
jgi:hypothetical protein